MLSSSHITDYQYHLSEVEELVVVVVVVVVVLVVVMVVVMVQPV